MKKSTVAVLAIAILFIGGTAGANVIFHNVAVVDDLVQPLGLGLDAGFTYLSDDEGNSQVCADGTPVLVPLDDTLLASIPVENALGEVFESPAAFQADLDARRASGELPSVVVTEGELIVDEVQLGPADLMRPVGSALCEAFTLINGQLALR